MPILINGCLSKNKIDENLIGEWNIFYLIHNEKNLLENYENGSFMTGYLKITKDGYFIIDNLDGYKIDGEIMNKEEDKLEIKSYSESRINNTYDLSLKLENESKVIMTMISENTELYAEKRNVDLSKFK